LDSMPVLFHFLNHFSARHPGQLSSFSSHPCPNIEVFWRFTITFHQIDAATSTFNGEKRIGRIYKDHSADGCGIFSGLVSFAHTLEWLERCQWSVKRS
jgi:hypothetical protein